MTQIAIRYSDGSVEQRTLSRRQPVSFGRHPSNDIAVDEPGIAAMHCRISWNGQAYEVAAASPAGVDVNGTLVRHADLSRGDVIRIGSVDVFLGEGPAAPPLAAKHAGDEVALKPVSADEIAVPRRPHPTLVERLADRPRGGPVPASPQEHAEPPAKPQAVRSSASSAVPKHVDDLPAERFDEPEPLVSHRVAGAQSAPSPTSKGSLLSRWRSPPVRPGEQDVLRSPLVLGMGGVTLALLLAGAVFWFMIRREASQRLYESAVQDLGTGKITQAIGQFDAFLRQYPRHPLAGPARIGLGKARIEKEIAGAGAAADWSRGLAALEAFVREHRDSPDFSRRQPEIARFAERIALGAAESARQSASREQLETASAAALLAERYSPHERFRTAFQRSYQPLSRQAEAAVRKEATLQGAIGEMKQHLADRNAIAALEARGRLMTRYPELDQSPLVMRLLADGLALEADLVERDEPDRAAVVDGRVVDAGPLVFTPHSRTRSDERSENRTIYALAAGTCFALDTVTGDPLWRRTVGETPFFPLAVTASEPAVLVFDDRRGELLLLHHIQGSVLWRQPIDARPTGAPLIHEGQIYLATEAGTLLQIDLATGRLATRLTFSQPLAGTPAVTSDGERMVVAGRAGLLYTLSLRPLACERATFLGHGADAVAAPLMWLGSLLLVAENDRLDSARLRVLDARPAAREWLAELDSVRVAGLVHGRPVLRGRQLFVPSTGERITAFTASDEPGRRPLTEVARYQVPTPRPGPLFLATGPDGQLWMAGSAIRKLQLATDSLRPETSALAGGLAAQPLQQLGNFLFPARRPAFSRAVQLTRLDRDQMTGDWRTVLGGRVAAGIASGETLTVVLDTGDVFRVSAADLLRGGFRHTVTTTLAIPDDLAEPLRIAHLAPDQIAVAAGLPQPTLWIVNAQGQIVREIPLDRPLEADPIVLEAGLVLPLPGRLHLVPPSDGPQPEDFLAPIGRDAAPAWAHLIQVDGTRCMAVDADGLLRRMEYRDGPLPHLAAVAQVELGGPLAAAPAVHRGRLLVPLPENRLQVLDTSSLEPVGELAFDAPIHGSLMVTGDLLLVETTDHRLTAVRLGDDVAKEWSIETGGPLAGVVRRNEEFIIALRDGGILTLAVADGRELARSRLDASLTAAPIAVGTLLVVPSIDGAWYRIDFPNQDEE